MVRMIRPDGGLCWVLESRVPEYRAAGFRPADPSRSPGVSGLDTASEKPIKPLRKRKGLEITQ